MSNVVSAQVSSPAPGLFGGPVLFSFAHPDDESFTCAGTISLAVRAGVPVTVISATRGERGESAVPGVDTPEAMAAVRDQELRSAMALLGVSDVRFLGYWDSGMDGTPTNNDPRAFVQAPRDDVVTRLIVQIRGLKPALVVTFGPEGGYGHPDHIAIHHATVEAVSLAANPAYRPELGEAWRIDALYYTAAPREILLKFAERNEGPFRHLSEEARQRIGVPDASITTRIRVTSELRRKANAILQHKTQVGDPSRFDPESSGSPNHWRMLDDEHYIRARLPWDGNDPLPDPLLVLNK